MQYYIEEQKGNIDYQGWAGKQDYDYDDDVNIVTVKFAWQVCQSVFVCVRARARADNLIKFAWQVCQSACVCALIIRSSSRGLTRLDHVEY